VSAQQGGLGSGDREPDGADREAQDAHAGSRPRATWVTARHQHQLVYQHAPASRAQAQQVQAHARTCEKGTGTTRACTCASLARALARDRTGSPVPFITWLTRSPGSALPVLSTPAPPPPAREPADSPGSAFPFPLPRPVALALPPDGVRSSPRVTAAALGIGIWRSGSSRLRYVSIFAPTRWILWARTSCPLEE
jgi:hypothetical protein